MQTATERFLSIFEQKQQEQLIELLRSLTIAQRKELAPLLRPLDKEYFTPIWEGADARHPIKKGNDTQFAMLAMTGFVCLNRVDFLRLSGPFMILDEQRYEQIINWYCPPWFSEYINGLAAANMLFHTFTYDTVLDLLDRGLLQPSPQLIVLLLPPYIYENIDRKNYVVADKLQLHPITLSEHIWYLFERQSNMFTAHHHWRWPEGTHAGWDVVLATLAFEGVIDRQRLLQESLRALSRSFNKTSAGWFMNLFSQLKPSSSELLTLQVDLLAGLSSSHSKVVNSCLKHLKVVLYDEDFTLPALMDHVPSLLSSSTKNTVLTTLSVLEQVAIRKPEYRSKIVEVVLQLFVHPDDEVQSKAARMIMAYADASDDQFIITLAQYFGTMLTSARSTLQPLLQQHDTAINKSGVEQADCQQQPDYLVSRSFPEEIPGINSIDDYVFLMSQALENIQTWLVDQVAAGSVYWLPKMKDNDVGRLAPALQRALAIKNGLGTNQGWLDQLLSNYIVDICQWLIQQRSESASLLQDQFDKWLHQQEKNGWSRRGNTLWAGVADFETDIYTAIYHPFKMILLTSLDRVKSGSQLPLLSTPTHQPSWIMPGVFLERLHKYQQDGRWPDSMDLQVALSRVYLPETHAAADLVNQQLQAEYLQLCRFLFGLDVEPTGVIEHPADWMAAALALPVKKKWPVLVPTEGYARTFLFYSGQFEWQLVGEGQVQHKFDHGMQAMTMVTNTKSKLELIRHRVDKRSEVPHELLYDRLRINPLHLYNLDCDVQRILLLSPNHPEPFLALLLSEYLRFSNLAGKLEARIIARVTNTLRQIWQRPGKMGHTFLALVLLSSDKTAAAIAGEIWLAQTPVGAIDQPVLGNAIGRLLAAGFLPTKRFTDLVVNQWMRVSGTHDVELLNLFQFILLELPDEPVNGLKKILECYFEIKDTSKALITDESLRQRLAFWGQVASLKKITQQLLS